MACAIIDRAIQIHGGGGMSDDFPLAYFYVWARALRLADGPDEVHLRTVARQELAAPLALHARRMPFAAARPHSVRTLTAKSQPRLCERRSEAVSGSARDAAPRLRRARVPCSEAG